MILRGCVPINSGNASNRRLVSAVEESGPRSVKRDGQAGELEQYES